MPCMPPCTRLAQSNAQDSTDEPAGVEAVLSVRAGVRFCGCFMPAVNHIELLAGGCRRGRESEGGTEGSGGAFGRLGRLLGREPSSQEERTRLVGGGGNGNLDSIFARMNTQSVRPCATGYCRLIDLHLQPGVTVSSVWGCPGPHNLPAMFSSSRHGAAHSCDLC